MTGQNILLCTILAKPGEGGMGSNYRTQGAALRFRLTTAVKNAFVRIVGVMLLFLQILPGHMLAQKDDIKFQHFTTENGLGHNHVTCILQDTRGFLWIGTLGGLWRYDGHNLRFARYAQDDSTGLSHPEIQSLYEDSEGNLWVGMQRGGLNLFDRETGRSIRYEHDPADSNSLSDGVVRVIFENQRKPGELWIGTSTGLCRMKRDKEGKAQFLRYHHNPGNKNSLSHNAVHAICQDSSGIFWIGTGDGLGRFDPDAGIYTHYKPKLPVIGTSYALAVRSLVNDGDSLLWLGTHSGLIKFSLGTKAFVFYRHQPKNPNSLSDNRVNSVCLDQFGIFWIATAAGLNRFDAETETFTSYHHDPDDPYSLSDNQLLSLYQDRSGVLWIGSGNGGLNKLPFRHKNFKHYKRHKNVSNTLNANRVLAIHEDRLGRLWIGTNSGLNIFDERRQTISHFQHDPTRPNSSLSSNVVNAILEDSMGRFWVGTAQGLNLFDPETGTFTQYTHAPDDPNSLSHSSVTKLHEDCQNIVWIGTTEGLTEFNQNTGSFTNYRYDPEDPHSLSYNNVWSIYESSSGVLWIGTADMLDKLDRNTKTFKHYDPYKERPGYGVNGLLEDARGNLWFSGSKGLVTFNCQTETFRHYDASDGLQGAVFTNAHFKNRKGEIFYGGSNGFNAFFPEEIQDNLQIPPIVFTGFRLLNESVPSLHGNVPVDIIIGWSPEASDGSPVLQKSISRTQEIVLSHLDDTFSIEFAALDFTAPEKNQYAYKLKGGHNEWVYLGTQRSLTFTNLSPGTYNLRVKGSNNDGLWNETGASLRITITPPWWRTRWAYALYVQRNAHRLRRLVDQLLDLSRIEARRMPLRAHQADIVPRIKEWIASFVSLAESKKITMKLHFPEQPVLAYFDPEKLEKIVYNLLSNAFKFTPKGGSVSVQLAVSSDQLPANQLNTDHCLLITVKDTGIGIPKDQLPHIFDRFYRASDALTGEQGGTGIGLALTKEFVELHHGKIRVESEPGKGSTFTVLLPLGRDHLSDDEIIELVADGEPPEPSRRSLDWMNAEAATSRTEVSAKAGVDQPSVVIVEDNDDMRRYLRNCLNQDFEVIEAENGKSGYQTAIEKAPDLVVSDIMMPGMDGYELCRKLKTDERTSHIPVILLTARAGQEDKLEGLEIGADDYLTKPFDARELQIRVKNLIEQRQRLRERFSREITVQPKDITVTSIDEKFLQQAIDIVEANMSDGDFQIDQFCRAIGMSRSTLNRKLRALTGLSTNVFIRTLRLKRAAQLLEKKSATIVEIAYEVGFNNPSYFAECFRQQFGRSPSEYTSN